MIIYYILAIASDYLYDKFSRTLILALGTFTFSAGELLFSTVSHCTLVHRPIFVICQKDCRTFKLPVFVMYRGRLISLK